MSVALRLMAFDAQVLARRQLPNHDLSQGASFFATNLHSLRWFGELVWWNPLVDGGYDQMYQSSLSPLAPTTHSLWFLVWSVAARAAAGAGLTISEYDQYLAMNLVLMPFVAYAAFAWFQRQLGFRAPVVVIGTFIYALSGIGVWNNSWFYYQEAAAVFLVLAAVMSFTSQPSVPRLAILGCAILLQFSAFNYWTLYALPFEILVVGLLLAMDRPRRIATVQWLRCRSARGRKGVVIGALLFGLTAAATFVGALVVGNAGDYHRGVAYTQDHAFERVKEMRLFTVQLFDPRIDRAIEHYPTENPPHAARYVGAFLLPFLVAGLLLTWRARERFLAALAFALLVVCMAPGPLLLLWDIVPMLDQIQHFFYFYTHYLQIVVVLFALAALDRLARSVEPADRRVGFRVGLGTTALAGLVLGGVFIGSSVFGPGSSVLESVLTATVVAAIPGFVLYRSFRPGATPSPPLLLTIVGVIAAADLSVFYHGVERADTEFTAGRWEQPTASFPAERLAEPWPKPDTERGYDQRVASAMPIVNDFWPENRFLRTSRATLFATTGADHRLEIRFAAPALRVSGQQAGVEATAKHPKAVVIESDTARPDTTTAQVVPARTLPATFLEWSYNHSRLAVDVPDDGWLTIPSEIDDDWELRLDGRTVEPLPANVVSMAVHVDAGHHVVELDYRPPARRIFLPVIGAVALALLTMAALALVRPRTRRESELPIDTEGGVGDNDEDQQTRF